MLTGLYENFFPIDEVARIISETCAAAKSNEKFRTTPFFTFDPLGFSGLLLVPKKLYEVILIPRSILSAERYRKSEPFRL
jgi:hypothetical protein